MLSKKHLKWRQVLVLYLVFAAIGVTIGLVPSDNRALSTVVAILLAVVMPAMLVFIFLLIALHELGHLIAGRWAGMDVVGFCAGPLRWLKTGNRWKFSWFDDLRLGGCVIAHPRSTTDFARQFLWMYLGGPFASLVAFLIVSSFALFFPSQWIWLWPLVLVSAIFLINFIPMRTHGVASDGHWIYALLFRPQEAATRLTTTRLFAYAQQDVPGKEWPGELVQELAKIQGDTLEALVARSFEVSYAISTKDAKFARKSVEELGRLYSLDKFPDPGASLKAAVFLQRAYVKAKFDADARGARDLIAQSGPVSDQLMFFQHEVLALIFKLEGDEESAKSAAEQASTSARKTFSAKPRILADVDARIRAILDAPDEPQP